ncbi:MAG: hypothetical protein M1823_006683, partial [Watsoniomyces obsoletus]
MRSSTPTEQHERKKKRFSAMGNLFSRGTKSEKSGQPQRASTLPTNSAGPSRAHQPRAYPQQYGPAPHEGAMYSRPGQQFQGSPPPPGGYYAPPQQQLASSSAQAQQQFAYEYPQPRPSDLRIDTKGGNRMSPHQAGPATAPPQPYVSREMSYQTQPSEYLAPSARVQSPITTAAPTSATGSASRSHDAHVVALHKRSRSPKLGRRPSSEDTRHLAPSPAAGDAHTPVEGLGTFSSKKISPVGGIPRPDQDQEAPFRIGIPGGNLGEEERRRRIRQSTIEKGGM